MVDPVSKSAANSLLGFQELNIPRTPEWRQLEKATLVQKAAGEFPISVPHNFQIIAHRGASGYAPDHSLEAFQIAKNLGAKHVEIDAQVSKDGVVVLCHDKKLDAYGHQGQIRNLNYHGELDQLDMGSWKNPRFAGAKMMTLDELLVKFDRSFIYHIELKSGQSQLANEILKVVDRHKMRDNILFTCCTPTLLQIAKDLAPEVPRAYLVRYVDYRVMAIAKRLEVQQLCPRADTITPELVGTIRDQGIPMVRAWGVSWLTKDSSEYLWRTKQVVDSGCDGTTIDHPDYLIPTAL